MYLGQKASVTQPIQDRAIDDAPTFAAVTGFVRTLDQESQAALKFAERLPVENDPQVAAAYIIALIRAKDAAEVVKRLHGCMVDPANFTTPEDLHTCEIQNDTVRTMAHALGVLEELEALTKGE